MRRRALQAPCGCCDHGGKWHRRTFLKAGLAFGATALPFGPASWAGTSRERTLHLHNLHTDETIRTTYWANGEYLPDGLAEFNHLLRDHHTGEVTAMDPHLLDALYRLQGELGTRGGRIFVTSAYRSPETNQQLKQQGFNPAPRSLHMEGKALDIALPDRPLQRVYRAALGLEIGGVGYYPDTGIVHLDVGEVRRWYGG